MATLNNKHKIDHLTLTEGIIQKLKNEGVVRIAALRKMRKNELLNIDLFGPIRVNQIKAALKKAHVPSYHMR